MPRSNSRSSTFRSDSGKRTYISTTKRITSGEELKRRKGLGARCHVALTVPEKLLVQRVPPAVSIKDLAAAAKLPWVEQNSAVFE